MLTRAIAVTFGIALTAAPGAAQTDHQHDHALDQDSQGAQSMMMHEMMMACPFFQGMEMHDGTMGMTDGGMMGMGDHGAMDHEMMNGMESRGSGMMGMGMMRVGPPGPAYLISMKDELGLAGTQVEELQAFQDRALQAMQSEMELAEGARSRAAEVLNLNPTGFDEYSEALRAAADHMTEAHIAMIQSGFEAQNLLTPEQRAAVSESLTGGETPGMMSGRLMNGSGEPATGHMRGQC